MREGRVVILAVPCQFQSTLASLSELRPGTVVVDCSNRWVKQSWRWEFYFSFNLINTILVSQPSLTSTRRVSQILMNKQKVSKSVKCYLNYRYSKIKDGKLTHAEELSRILPTTVSIVKALNSLDVTDLEGERTIVKASHCNRYRVNQNKRLLRTCLIF